MSFSPHARSDTYKIRIVQTIGDDRTIGVTWITKMVLRSSHSIYIMVLRNVDEDFLARAGRGSEMMADEPRVRMVGTVCGLRVVEAAS